MDEQPTTAIQQLEDNNNPGTEVARIVSMLRESLAVPGRTVSTFQRPRPHAIKMPARSSCSILLPRRMA